MNYEKEISILMPLMKEKLVDIGIFMYQSKGFPIEYFINEISKMNSLETLGFINYFMSRNKGAGKPIYFKDLQSV